MILSLGAFEKVKLYKARHLVEMTLAQELAHPHQAAAIRFNSRLLIKTSLIGPAASEPRDQEAEDCQLCSVLTF
jgi:hypothetical protein